MRLEGLTLRGELRRDLRGDVRRGERRGERRRPRLLLRSVRRLGEGETRRRRGDGERRLGRSPPPRSALALAGERRGERERPRAARPNIQLPATTVLTFPESLLLRGEGERDELELLEEREDPDESLKNL
ncbi:unnamed protein product [Strongylus vulgaris]|uniref:Uncharacterized protein n=1 Tax=Strongylus vulgaris TaxID=40348 RepID=A0A3P7K104_STRVU|nr:unnamed protein product [Strongylus vulgaris]